MIEVSRLLLRTLKDLSSMLCSNESGSGSESDLDPCLKDWVGLSRQDLDPFIRIRLFEGVPVL
jgi:hypothetical protein